MNSFVPLRRLVPWPEHLFPSTTSENGSSSFLDWVGLSSFSSQRTPTSRELAVELRVLREVGLGFAPLPEFALILGSDTGSTSLAATLSIGDKTGLRLNQLTFRLRFPSTLFKPARLESGEYVEDVDENGSLRPYEIAVENVSISVDGNGNLEIENTPAIRLAPVMIGDTGVVIEAESLALYLSSNDVLPADAPETFKGIFLAAANIYLPQGLQDGFPDQIRFENCYIGAGGFTGRVALSEVAGARSADLGGFSFTPQSLSLSFVQNAIMDGALTGQLTVPFFDEDVSVALNLGVDGSFGLTLTDADENGLCSLTKPGLGTVKLSSLGVNLNDEGAELILSGSLQLEVGSPELQWPEIQIESLRVSPDGKVTIAGGWLNLQEPLSLDLFGFRMEISQIGFGNEEDGRRWIGFSGGVHLVDMLPTGASVEGLRVIWDPTGERDPEITLQGVGIELTVPGVVHLSGDVALINEGITHEFRGNAILDLLPLGIGLDASVKIGRDSAQDFNYIYTFLSLQSPIGIPLWTTGAAIYGLSGLYGMNVTPSAEKGDWYGWYAGPPEEFSITNSGKWLGSPDSRAFGAGMVLGTLFDAGRVISAKALFAMILPGPVIMVNGKANLLQSLPELNGSSEGIFDALAVLDAQAGDLQLNIDAGWSLGKVIDINASAEAYFDFANPRNWHLYLGQDQPEDRRIRAYVISLFHADAYLMIDSDGIAAGFGVNWGEDWRFGPVKVICRVWIEAGAGISWQPPQLEGSLSLGGEFEVSVAGFGIGLSCEARLSGKAPTLYWVRGDLLLRVKLPAPIKDLEEDITLEWKQEKEPPIQDPWKTIGIEHLKVDEAWTENVVSETGNDPTASGYQPGPIVPLDARPSITFDRAMADESSGSFTPIAQAPAKTTIGEYTLSYKLQNVSLEKWSKAAGRSWEPVDDLFGVWMAIEDGEGKPAASKLQLWTKSPFAFTRQSSRTYRDSFLRLNPSWPCVDVPDQARICVNWLEDESSPGIPVDPPVHGRFPGGPEPATTYPPVFEYEGLCFISGASSTVVALDHSDCGMRAALKFVDNDICSIIFPQPVRNVSICLESTFRAAMAFNHTGLLETLDDPSGQVNFAATAIDSITLVGWDGPIVSRICYELETTALERESAQEYSNRVIAGLTHWTSQDEILEPEMWYRLTVTVAEERTHKGETTSTSFTHYGYFQTAGPPGLVPSWEVTPDVTLPDAISSKSYPEGGGLKDLSKYVQWAIPAHGANPVYRAYDVGLEFNENYVEQMYGADMVIRLLDANGLPVLDDQGNEVTMVNKWAEAPIAELTETELPYVTRVLDCHPTSTARLPANQNIVSSCGILFEEDFSGDLEQWNQPGQETIGSTWKPAQDGKLHYILLSPTDSHLLVAGDDEWTDYAVEVQLGEEGDDVGIVFRFTDANGEQYYRLRLDSEGRHLDRIDNGSVSSLWEDTLVYAPGSVEIIGIQCHGDRLRGQADSELLFDLHDTEGFRSGRVGIYANSSTATFEHFLVREWPGGALLSRTSYSAQLLSSFVLFQGGLMASGWIDRAFDWSDEFIRNNSHIVALGREDWDNYRVEVNVTPAERSVGLLVRFLLHDDGTFDTYRLTLAPDSLSLARLHGTYSTGSYEVDSRSVLWVCEGAACGVDFNLTEHSLAFSCHETTLVVEVDGQEIKRYIDDDAGSLRAGKAGLYYVGDDVPQFAELVVRSAFRQPVYEWSFVTSKFEGLVEHLDSFNGEINREEAVSAQGITRAINHAISGMQRANNDLDSARQALTNANETNLLSMRTAAQGAATALQLEANENFAALNELLFGSRYRPIPPIVEISEVFKRTDRHVLIFESPEPVDWVRTNVRLSRLDEASQLYVDLPDVLLVWNDDGTKAFISLDEAIPSGAYRLNFAYTLDLGAEAPVLRRSGSSLPEVAALMFSLA